MFVCNPKLLFFFDKKFKVTYRKTSRGYIQTKILGYIQTKDFRVHIKNLRVHSYKNLGLHIDKNLRLPTEKSFEVTYRQKN